MKNNKRKILVHLRGGLGNQLFQYATAYALAKNNDAELIIDNREYKKYKLHGGYRLNNFCIEGREISIKDKLLFPFFLSKLAWKYNFFVKNFRRYYIEKFGLTDKIENFVVLIGYWQNAEYFKEYYKNLVDIFTPIYIPKDGVKQYNEIKFGNSVCMHIRRGDYISNPNALNFHGICSLDYYKKAVNYLNEKIKDPVFFVFSDDREWCDINIPFILGDKIKYNLINENDQETDLWLMSKCKHHIIANSTFSWWGAWLAQSSDQIVIAPEPWFDIDIGITSPSLISWKKFNK
ncbi:MAG: alpha-1,2-fucosyltransferase [Candidatus Phlomobacter fragariae]